MVAGGRGSQVCISGGVLRGRKALLPLSVPQPLVTAPCCADASLPEDVVLLPQSLLAPLLCRQCAAAMLWLPCRHLPQELRCP